jgi:type I restriction enzyme M protein
MYLHKFTNPKINEYDTLSSEDRWNEYYDVILANPPFFSPKGGIMPHNRFGVKSTKAEVLFIDYIYEHLKPNGRAGIIVPEGVIFQTGIAYKQLRKKLIETSLVGVISLPAGVFQPYSGVKTSVLILDKKKSKKTEKIFFQKVNNDGYSLSSVRNLIQENDLPKVIDSFKENKDTDKFIEKEKLLKSSDYSFVFERYFESKRNSTTSKLIQIGEYFEILNGSTPSRKEKKYWDNKDIPWFTIEDIRLQGRTIRETSQHITKDALKETSVKLVPKLSTLICCTASVGEVAFNNIELTTNQQFNALIIKDEFKKEINPKFIFWISTSLKQEIKRIAGSTSFEYLSVTNLKKIKIPLPSIETQNQIVDELDSYQKIIDGCRQVIENYKPLIDIDPSWKMVELNKICDVRDGTHDSPKYVDDGYPLITSKNVINGSISFEKVNFISEKDFNDINRRSKVDMGDILMPMIGTIGRPTIVKTEADFAIKNVALIKTKNNISQEYIRLVLDSKLFENYLISNQAGSTQKFISLSAIRNFEVPVPPKNIEKKLIENINDEELIVSKNKDLISNFQNKIEKKINSLWSN